MSFLLPHIFSLCFSVHLPLEWKHFSWVLFRKSQITCTLFWDQALQEGFSLCKDVIKAGKKANSNASVLLKPIFHSEDEKVKEGKINIENSRFWAPVEPNLMTLTCLLLSLWHITTKPSALIVLVYPLLEMQSWDLNKLPSIFFSQKSSKPCGRIAYTFTLPFWWLVHAHKRGNV